MKKSQLIKTVSYISTILCLSLLLTNTVFAGGSSIQLTTQPALVAPSVFPGMRSRVIDFNVHVEPQFIQAAKIKDITVSCYAPKILSRAYLLNDRGRVIGNAAFKNDMNNEEGGDMISAKIRPTRLSRINAGDLVKNFSIAITPKQNAPIREIECGISHVSFIDIQTRSVVNEASILLDGYAYFENFVTQRISILEENNRIIRIQGK